MISNPHDGLFKSVFCQPEHARGELRAVVPAELAEALDWSTLTLRPGSFVDAALAHQHTDLLYSTTWRDGGEAPVYFLFEHQSTLPSDGLMAHRLLRYQGRIWERWRSDHPKAKKLPVIIPIVMYHGEAPWSEPRSFDGLLDMSDGMRPVIERYVMRFEYLLDDLSKISDDELRDGELRTALAKLVAMCFKHARIGRGFIEILGRWMNVVRAVAWAPNGLEALAQIMRYILEVNEDVEPEALRSLLEREIGPEAKDTIVTAGQRLIEQGRQQGIEQGLQQGLQQGIEQGRQQGLEQARQHLQKMLRHLLRQRFGAEVDAQVEQRITTASFEQIEAWSERVLTTATLAELLDG
jgi:predicted transposase/invertase (TIGR01784 family)